MVRAARLCYFAPGETILSPAGRGRHCYIVKQGTVRGERPRAAAAPGDAVALWELAAGDMFPLGALLANRGVTSIYRATRDTFCLVFPAATFDALIASRRRSGISARAGSRICWICRARACRPNTRRMSLHGREWTRHWPTAAAGTCDSHP